MKLRASPGDTFLQKYIISSVLLSKTNWTPVHILEPITSRTKKLRNSLISHKSAIVSQRIYFFILAILDIHNLKILDFFLKCCWK